MSNERRPASRRHETLIRSRRRLDLVSPLPSSDRHSEEHTPSQDTSTHAADDTNVTIELTNLSLINPLTSHGCTHGSHLSVMAERQSARISKITNDGLTGSRTWCFIAVPIRQVGVKGLKPSTTGADLRFSSPQPVTSRSRKTTDGARASASHTYYTDCILRVIRNKTSNQVIKLANVTELNWVSVQRGQQGSQTNSASQRSSSMATLDFTVEIQK